MDVDDEGRTWRKDVISSARLSQVCFNLSYLAAGLADVPFPSNASPDQMGHIVPPAGSDLPRGLLPVGHAPPKEGTQEMMPEPPQVAPFDIKEQRLYIEVLQVSEYFPPIS